MEQFNLEELLNKVTENTDNVEKKFEFKAKNYQLYVLREKTSKSGKEYQEQLTVEFTPKPIGITLGDTWFDWDYVYEKPAKVADIKNVFGKVIGYSDNTEYANVTEAIKPILADLTAVKVKGYIKVSKADNGKYAIQIVSKSYQNQAKPFVIG